MLSGPSKQTAEQISQLTQQWISSNNMSLDVIIMDGMQQTHQLSVHSPGLQVIQDPGNCRLRAAWYADQTGEIVGWYTVVHLVEKKGVYEE